MDPCTYIIRFLSEDLTDLRRCKAQRRETFNLLGNRVFSQSTAKEMIDTIRERYNQIMDKRLDAPQYAKSETEESEKMLNMIKQHVVRGKKIANTYLKID